jgi:hypothetical protein
MDIPPGDQPKIWEHCGNPFDDMPNHTLYHICYRYATRIGAKQGWKSQKEREQFAEETRQLLVACAFRLNPAARNSHPNIISPVRDIDHYRPLRLRKPIKLEIEAGGRVYTVSISARGITWAEGHEQPLSVSWDDLVSERLTYALGLTKPFG